MSARGVALAVLLLATHACAFAVGAYVYQSPVPALVRAAAGERGVSVVAGLALGARELRQFAADAQRAYDWAAVYAQLESANKRCVQQLGRTQAAAEVAFTQRAAALSDAALATAQFQMRWETIYAQDDVCRAWADQPVCPELVRLLDAAAAGDRDRARADRSAAGSADRPAATARGVPADTKDR